MPEQQLVEGLRVGLAHPMQAEWTIGLLLERLDLDSAKNDSFIDFTAANRSVVLGKNVVEKEKRDLGKRSEGYVGSS